MSRGLGTLTVAGSVFAAACGQTSRDRVTDVPAGNDVAGAPGDGGEGGTGGSDGGASNGGNQAYPSCRCTRQAESEQIGCPKGAGETVRANIGPEGGVVNLRGRQGKSSGVDFSLDFSPGAFSETTRVSVSETTGALPADFVDFSPLYLVEAEGSLSAAVAIVVPWSNRAVVAGDVLSIYRIGSEDGVPERVADSYINALFMQGSVREFGYFFAGYPVGAEDRCP